MSVYRDLGVSAVTHGPQRTVLDDVPTPTDQMLAEAGACPLRARSGGNQGTHGHSAAYFNLEAREVLH